MKQRLIAAAALVAAALGGAAIAVGALALADDDTTTVATQTQPRATTAIASAEALPVQEIASRAAASVVEIRTSAVQDQGVFGQEQEGQGSGWVYDDQGHIVTNAHVVEGATTLTVVLADGEERAAELVGSDASTDIAVVQVNDPTGLKPLTLGSSQDLEVGDTVVAIGSPFGLQGSVTVGIVSALEREIRSPNGFAIDNAIQTDAALNGGNSGGPLLDDRARVVGVNAQISTRSGGNDGVGFAIPVETAKSVADGLIGTGSVQHAYLGVSLAEDSSDGVRVESVVAGGPSAAAGVEAGDVIVAADGSGVATAADLRAALDARKPGDELELTVRRDGDEQTIAVTLGNRPTGS